MKFFKKNVFLVLSFVFVAISCVTVYYSVSDKNVSYLYNPASMGLHPEFCVYHNSDSVSFLFFKIYTPELLFVEQQKNVKTKKSKRCNSLSVI